MALSEFELILRYFTAYQDGYAVVTGIGDDCAQLSLSPGYSLCTSIDTMVEGIHFPKNVAPDKLGWRVLAAAVSDLAAAGAAPMGFCLALTLPDSDEAWLSAFSQGLIEAAKAFEIPLVGGDTTRGPLCLSVQVFGEVAEGAMLTRAAARPGDDIWVTGTLGDARAALDCLDSAEPDAAQQTFLDQYYRARPPLMFARQMPGLAHAGIDISDGLLADLGHILKASQRGAILNLEALPLSEALAGTYSTAQSRDYALTGGDDYQLCFTAPVAKRDQLTHCAREYGVSVARIGEITDAETLTILDHGKAVSLDILTNKGYLHFS